MDAPSLPQLRSLSLAFSARLRVKGSYPPPPPLFLTRSVISGKENGLGRRGSLDVLGPFSVFQCRPSPSTTITDSTWHFSKQQAWVFAHTRVHASSASTKKDSRCHSAGFSCHPLPPSLSSPFGRTPRGPSSQAVLRAQSCHDWLRSSLQ